ncbi:hypothetical protein [Terribacillus saccharophilus]|uniref:hypothetical protein n=1 Tax=Terribacillus saccharophilus TaxID=361277 RepID=UPI001C3ECD95|nr:hypothetical protein [Terribacillus saccharophilus]
MKDETRRPMFLMISAEKENIGFSETLYQEKEHLKAINPPLSGALMWKQKKA